MKCEKERGRCACGDLGGETGFPVVRFLHRGAESGSFYPGYGVTGRLPSLFRYASGAVVGAMSDAAELERFTPMVVTSHRRPLLTQPISPCGIASG